jgi:hypothetical protein
LFKKFLQKYKKEEENQETTVVYKHVSSNFKRFKFYKLYLLINTIKISRFVTPRRFFNFKALKRVFSFYDIPYHDFFFKTNFIDPFKLYLIYLKIDLGNRPAQFFFETLATTNMYSFLPVEEKKDLSFKKVG